MSNPWPAGDAKLRELWASGMKTLEIAARMGLTKGSIVGRAHRLKLTRRESPIIHTGLQRRSKPRVAGAVTLPVLFAIKSEPVGLAAAPSRVAPSVPASDRGIVFYAPRKAAQCCFPIGEPRRPGFRFCDALGVPGRSYCDAHCRAA